MTMHIGSLLQSIVIIRQALVIQSHQMKNGGIEIIYTDFPPYLKAKIITFHKCILYSGTGKEAGKRIRIVIPAVPLPCKNIPKPAPNNQSIFKQSPPFHRWSRQPGWSMISACIAWVLWILLCESQLVMPLPPEGSLPLNSCTTRTPFSSNRRASRQFLAYSFFRSVPESSPYSFWSIRVLWKYPSHQESRFASFLPIHSWRSGGQIGIAGIFFKVYSIQSRSRLMWNDHLRCVTCGLDKLAGGFLALKSVLKCGGQKPVSKLFLPERAGPRIINRNKGGKFLIFWTECVWSRHQRKEILPW